jgi:DNA repair/transcription protein MET18/MMS19
LKLRLRECISATHYFAADAIPQLLDKMNSSSPVVKIDTLQTLTACAANYGPQTISTYSNSIWDSVRFEILNANDEDVSARALELLKAITKTLSFGLVEATRTSPLAQFLKTVTETCNKELRDPEAKLARPAGTVLASCASVSPPANKLIIEKTLPILIMLFKETESVNKRTAILDILNGFLDSTATVYTDADPESIPIMLVKDDLFDVYSKGFLGSSSDETTYKLTALEGFRKLLSLKGVLSINETGIVVQYFDDVVLRDENEETWYVELRIY